LLFIILKVKDKDIRTYLPYNLSAINYHFKVREGSMHISLSITLLLLVYSIVSTFLYDIVKASRYLLLSPTLQIRPLARFSVS